MIFIIAFSVLLLDQFTKLLILKNLSLNHSLPLINGVAHLTLVHNRGAAFGILKNQTTLFIFVSIFAVILISSALRKSGWRRVSFYSLSLILILAGAVGNLIDRLRFGYVVDFLDLRVWPVFNVADSAITVGAIMLGWLILFRSK
jgi:signal peptidase II